MNWFQFNIGSGDHTNSTTHDGALCIWSKKTTCIDFVDCTYIHFATSWMHKSMSNKWSVWKLLKSLRTTLLTQKGFYLLRYYWMAASFLFRKPCQSIINGNVYVLSIELVIPKVRRNKKKSIAQIESFPLLKATMENNYVISSNEIWFKCFTRGLNLL